MDPAQEQALRALRELFDQNRQNVYYHRQLQIMYEEKWFHWVTYRALRSRSAPKASV